jgi:sortase A
MSDTNSQDSSSTDYRLPSRDKKVLQPLHDDLTVSPLGNGANPAADLIRKKLLDLYDDEPKAKEEIAEVEHIGHRSKHQQFMYDLSHSGKSLAQIQTEWHEYYTKLPNDEKHQVWQEFYANQPVDPQVPPETKPQKSPNHKHKDTKSRTLKKEDSRSVSDIKNQLLGKVQTRAKSQQKQHLQSLMFGLSMGALVIVVFLFGFFNERFIAPFITPSRSVSSTPIVIDPASSAVGNESKIIIPKINVEIPVVYDEPSIDEDAIQRALEKGVVHYPTTSSPGEIGNGVVFGHSANNILNKGKYKFAFVLLKRLEAGDTFYIQKDGKRYVYKVFDKKVVPPTEVSVLYPSFPDKSSTFTLITCDPPGTSLNRLVVIAEQISPDPGTNLASSAKQVSNPEILPSNSPTLWDRLTGWL